MTERVDGYLPLRGYAVISDGRTCALVGSDGTVDWWTLPTMAAGPTFGALLDAQAGGRMMLRPVPDAEAARRYVDDGGVLETTFRSGGGTVRVTDALTMSGGCPPPWRELARRVECLDGEVEMSWEVAPGNRFATAAPWSRTYDGTPLITAGRTSRSSSTRRVPPQFGGGTVSGRVTARPDTRSLLAVVATRRRPVPGPGRRRDRPSDRRDGRALGAVAGPDPLRRAVVRRGPPQRGRAETAHLRRVGCGAVRGDDLAAGADRRQP